MAQGALQRPAVRARPEVRYTTADACARPRLSYTPKLIDRSGRNDRYLLRLQDALSDRSDYARAERPDGPLRQMRPRLAAGAAFGHASARRCVAATRPH